MFEYDSMQPDALMEPEALISRDRERERAGDVRSTAASMPIRTLPIKRPLLLTADTSVAEAARRMMEDDARAALIVSGESVLGVVTENDVWRAMTVNFSG